MKGTERLCQRCGKPFQGARDSYFCSKCAAKAKAESTIRLRTCVDCGASFTGGPRAKRCPDCRHKAQAVSYKKYRQAGAARKLGSLDQCAACGKDYIVKSGLQKYCPDCQRDALLQWQRDHKKGYNQKPEVMEQKAKRRQSQLKLCAYCNRPFHASTSSSLCSDYCREENAKLVQCLSDIKRGQNRNLEKYLSRREAYRKHVQQSEPNGCQSSNL